MCCEDPQVKISTVHYPPPDIQLKILHRMDEIHTEIPSYGYRRQYKQLSEEAYNISPETVRKYMRVLGLEAIYPKKKTTISDKSHAVYPYLLKDLDIGHVNQVWESKGSVNRYPINRVHIHGTPIPVSDSDPKRYICFGSCHDIFHYSQRSGCCCFG